MTEATAAGAAEHIAAAVRDTAAEDAYLATLALTRQTERLVARAFRAGWQEGVMRGWDERGDHTDG